MPGILYIVSTPIGNLEDVTLRALRILKEVDHIAAEDTRHSRKLLSHYGITNELSSYWGEREKARSEKIIEVLKQNKDVALISDAGTPGISDPGEVLIRKAIDEGIEVITVPGPSAIISALTVSGISASNFMYLGFVPSKKMERKRFYQDISFEKRTMIMYESPHRLIDSLNDLATIMPLREIAVCHELTKLNESVYRGPVDDVVSMLMDETIAGEYVIVVSGSRRESVPLDEALDEVRKLMKAGMGRKEAVNKTARDYGLSKKKLYDISLEKDVL
jgi:16S rRNA (cytidine1402-2'-O)-methyltransferase